MIVKNTPSFQVLTTLVCAALFSLNSLAQCDGVRYREFVFPSFLKTPNLVYGSNTSYTGAATSLTLDVYEPEGDSLDLRPLVILAHGGFFISGSKEGTDVVPMCEDLAKMGYVTASINYRLGWPVENDLGPPLTEAVMRGVQDMKAAIRYFRKDAEENSNTYNIDPNQIYIAGVSAGGFITLHLAYLDQDSEIPSNINLNNPGLSGGLEGDSGNAGYSSDVNAIISISGAIGDTSWIYAGDTPACLFHGTNDNTVPFGSDMLYVLGFNPVTEVDGSNSIDQKMNQVGLEHCFEIYEGQDHVPHVSNPAYYDTTFSIMTNFLSHYICNEPLDCSYREIATSITEEDPDALQDLSLYPNPATDRIYFTVPDRIKVSIYDLSGRLVHVTNESKSMDISSLSNGMYLIELKNANTIHRERWMKE